MRLLTLSLLYSLSFISAACSLPKKDLILGPASPHGSVKYAECRARAYIDIEDLTTGQSLKAQTGIQFELAGKASRLDMIFYTPFGTRAGRLLLGPDQSEWKDSKNTYQISRHPIFGKWYRSTWWNEMAFLLGMLTKENISSTQVDDEERPRELNLSDRRIKCDYGRHEDGKSCRMEITDISGSIDFKNIECSRVYEIEAGGDSSRRK